MNNTINTTDVGSVCNCSREALISEVFENLFYDTHGLVFVGIAGD